MEITIVRDLEKIQKEHPGKYQLVQNSHDIHGTLEFAGLLDEEDDVGCLFITIPDSSVEEIWACSSSVPFLCKPVWRLK